MNYYTRISNKYTCESIVARLRISPERLNAMSYMWLFALYDRIISFDYASHLQLSTTVVS